MYYEDEYDDYAYDADEPERWVSYKELVKDDNGHLIYVIAYGMWYRGMSSDEGIWSSDYYTMKDCDQWFVERAIAWSRTVKNGSYIDVSGWSPEDEA